MPSSDILLDKRTSFFIAVEKEDDTIQAPLRCEDLTIFRVKLRNIIASFVESLSVMVYLSAAIYQDYDDIIFSFMGSWASRNLYVIKLWYFSSFFPPKNFRNNKPTDNR